MRLFLNHDFFASSLIFLLTQARTSWFSCVRFSFTYISVPLNNFLLLKIWSLLILELSLTIAHPGTMISGRSLVLLDFIIPSLCAILTSSLFKSRLGIIPFIFINGSAVAQW